MCYFPNTIVALLQKRPWQTLHTVIGDDLMIHLLMNYVIIVELQDVEHSYVQVAGKSLRFQNSLSSTFNNPRPPAFNNDNNKSKPERDVLMKDGAISMNQVLYARHFRKKKIFSGSHVLVEAAKSPQISRGVAGRIVRAIFNLDDSDAKGNTNKAKRLPKRLINLLPIIQTLIARFRDFDIETLTKKLLPIPSAFRKIMRESQSLKTIAEKPPGRLSDGFERVHAMTSRALDSEYLSQEDSDDTHEERKRKRREHAIESRSCASEPVDGIGVNQLGVSRKRPRKREKVSFASSYEVSTNLSKLQEHRDEISRLGECVVSKQVVYRLVRKFVARIIPKELWGPHTGSEKNWKRVKQLLRHFIDSRKYDIISLKVCCSELQVKNVKWMNTQGDPSCCPPNELVKRQKLFQDVLSWILRMIVFPLLRNLFYITEREGGSNEIVYYQREVWSAISNAAVYDLSAAVLHPVREACSYENARQLATSRLRLLPKVNGIRPLMNLSTSVDHTQISVNKSLEAVHRVLLFEADRQSKHLLGASVRSMDEIYQRIKPLFQAISSCGSCTERRNANGGGIPAVYCVSVDIERCFDTIRPRKLYRILKKAILEDEYLIRKHWVYRRSNLANMGKNRKRTSPIIFKMERRAFRSGDLCGFDELVAKSKKRNAVFLDGVLYDYLPKSKILSLLKEHLLHNVVQIDGQDFIQQQGIPQGSVLSTLLCNLYYGHFERKVLWRRLGKSCVPVAAKCCHHEDLLRYTDDSLLITTNLKRAQTFAKIMHEGNNEYGCYVNFAKSRVNFDVSVAEERGNCQSIPRFDQEESDGRFSWCGMLIDSITLQISVNYENSLAQPSIPLDETKALEDFFVNKVLSSIRQRWHPLYFDPSLLSRSTIQVNLFQMLCVAAVRFAVIVDMLPFVNRSVKFLHRSVHQILAMTTKGINRCVANVTTTAAAFKNGNLSKLTKEGVPNAVTSGEDSLKHKKAQCAVEKYEVWSIGLRSFQLILQQQLRQHDNGTARTKRQSKSKLDIASHWTLLLDLLQQDALRRQPHGPASPSNSARGDGEDPLQWLVQDTRNAFIISQLLRTPLPSPE